MSKVHLFLISRRDEWPGLHPRYKRPIAERLYLGMLSIAYNITDEGRYKGPFPTSVHSDNYSVTITFDRGAGDLHFNDVQTMYMGSPFEVPQCSNTSDVIPSGQGYGIGPVCLCVCVGLLRVHYTPQPWYMGYLCTRKAQYAPPRRNITWHHTMTSQCHMTLRHDVVTSHSDTFRQKQWQRGHDAVGGVNTQAFWFAIYLMSKSWRLKMSRENVALLFIQKF